MTTRPVKILSDPTVFAQICNVITVYLLVMRDKLQICKAADIPDTQVGNWTANIDYCLLRHL